MTTLTPGKWTLDASHSEAMFSVRHAGISRVRGTFEDFSGSAEFTENLNGSVINAEVQTASVNTRNEGRDEHLRSADFFDAENHPVLKFESLKVTDFDGEDFKLHGNLTLRGVTKEVEFKGEFGGQTVDAFGATRAGFEAETEISREEFGLTWNAALEAGGFLVSDKVRITLDVSFTKDEE
ncbi:YceI family protein [Enteractinococcus coprophilus]|uniref:Polyisoprenoid-binding protein YceI n=1 Tax=Enteractinococcus coprophilus TaxID=1027633 RepID=A0A543APE8_9MICC|nr:YceI family protein [Enteractinococcus coprophilus]TQL74461.1 polyisoprenoid-binding protein YceI [Enteractinococcus coprophilus]